MEFVLITSSYSKLCNTLENHRSMRKIKYKRIKIDSEQMKSLLKRNGIDNIPILIIRHNDNTTNRVKGCDNIVKFIENFTKLNTKVESIHEYIDYTTSVPEDTDNYDLVILGEKITKNIDTIENAIKFKSTDGVISSIAEKITGSKKKVLIISSKKNPIVQIVKVLYLSLVDNKEKGEIEEELGIKVDDIYPSLTKIIAQYFE